MATIATTNAAPTPTGPGTAASVTIIIAIANTNGSHLSLANVDSSPGLRRFPPTVAKR